MIHAYLQTQCQSPERTVKFVVLKVRKPSCIFVVQSCVRARKPIDFRGLNGLEEQGWRAGENRRAFIATRRCNAVFMSFATLIAQRAEVKGLRRWILFYCLSIGFPA